MGREDLIIIQSYSSQWPILAAEEIREVRCAIPKLINQTIEHIGSTAVPGLAAKPILDIAVSLPDIEVGSIAISPLETIGYSYWSKNPDPKHMFFVKGLPPMGRGRTHHLHFFETERFKDHIRFRDLLRSHPEIAMAYQELKVRLADKFCHDRDAYTIAKSHFILKALAEGK